MTHADDWEPVGYRDLPDWVKEDSKPRRWIKNTYKTVFYGDPYDYMVQYTVAQGNLTIAYWKTAHTFKREIKKPVKKIPRSSPRFLYAAIIVVVAVVGLVFLYQFLPSIRIPSLPQSPPAITSGVPDLSSPSQIPQTPIPETTIPPEITFRQSPKNTSFAYFINGNLRSMSFTTYGGFTDFLANKSHSYHYDPETGVVVELLENGDQNAYMQPFIEMIRKQSIRGDDQAKVAISLVQRIPFSGNTYTRTTTAWYYPYETVHNNRGSDTDKSVLLAYILNELGYETVLFEFTDHMAVGVKSSSKYAFYDTGFAYIEATQPTVITYVPENSFSMSQNPRIFHLSGGKKVLDVSTEYGDAMRMKQLEEKGGILNQSYRAELSRISDKYDLTYVSR